MAPRSRVRLPDSDAIMPGRILISRANQFAADPEFGGVLHEFRIYNAALSALQIQLTEQTGAEPPFF